jgi:hypothetical protein
MADPPLLVGAMKLTEALPLPAVAVPIVGAPGTPRGVTLLDALFSRAGAKRVNDRAWAKRP